MTYLKSDMGVVLRNEPCIDNFRISRKIGCNYQVRSDLYLQPNRLSNMFFSDSIFIVGLFPLRTYKTKLVLWYWLLSRKLNDFSDFMDSRPQPVRDHVVSIKGRSNSIDKMPKFWRLLVKNFIFSNFIFSMISRSASIRIDGIVVKPSMNKTRTKTRT